MGTSILFYESYASFGEFDAGDIAIRKSATSCIEVNWFIFK